MNFSLEIIGEEISRGYFVHLWKNVNFSSIIMTYRVLSYFLNYIRSVLFRIFCIFMETYSFFMNMRKEMEQ